MSKLAERCVRETFLGIDLWRRNTAPPTSQNTPLSLITFVYNHSVLSFEMWHLRRTNPCPIGQLQARTSAASLTSNSLKIDEGTSFFEQEIIRISILFQEIGSSTIYTTTDNFMLLHRPFTHTIPQADTMQHSSGSSSSSRPRQRTFTSCTECRRRKQRVCCFDYFT